MPRRKLKSDEVELWEQVAKTATPLSLPQYVNAVAKPKPKVNPKKKEKFELNKFEIGANAAQKSVKNDLKPSISTVLESFSPDGLQGIQKNEAGKKHPEASFDLHGMTVAQATQP